MTTLLPTRRPKPSEEGYILVAVMFMLALLVIAMSIAAPKIAKSIQREREIETMHRGKQYARAVKLYYKKFGAYPPNVDALVKTNEIRFLRKKYIDPTTGKDEWKIVRVGQQKTQTMGFFGQPIAGTGPIASGLTNSLTSSTLTPTDPTSTNPPADPGAGQTPPATPGSPTDPSNGQTSGPGSTPSGSTSAFGTPGQTFGGVGVMGFSPNSPKQSILVYKKKNHYNEWEFLYDPIADQMMMQGGLTGGTSVPGQTGSPGMPGGSPIVNPITPTPTPTPPPQQ
jgi:type II secretory pathway pseudopilin PulG